MSEFSWDAVKQRVHERANGCCEYCQTSEQNSGQTIQVDHIDPEGGDGVENLCLSCCNNHKRRATSVLDPETGTQVSLYNPRTQQWNEHFEWINGATYIRGRTSIGRATIVRLKVNRPAIVIARRAGQQEGIIRPNYNAYCRDFLTTW